jgi:hypothetical protein
MKDFPFFKLVPKSNNHKTGPMAVSTSHMGTCPEACAFRGRGCYADYGPIKMVWQACGRNTDNVRGDWQNFLYDLSKLPARTIFRHNQAGDLVGKDNSINFAAVLRLALVCASAKLKAYTYTHYPVVSTGTSADLRVINDNRKTIEEMNRTGITVNISANSPAHADMIVDSGIDAPVCVNLPSEVLKRAVKMGIKTLKTPKGRTIVICPAMLKEDMTCTKCMGCMSPTRRTIIGFPAHGTGCKRADAVIAEWEEKCK